MKSITIRESNASELTEFAALEQQNHASPFINQLSLAEHRNLFDEPLVIYLTVVSSINSIAGYFIIALDADKTTAEFRRVVIHERHLGIGQQAIGQMEQYCRNKLNCSAIWLDVYQDNAKGIHIYEKLGYQFDRSEAVGERVLRYYSKRLS